MKIPKGYWIKKTQYYWGLFYKDFNISFYDSYQKAREELAFYKAVGYLERETDRCIFDKEGFLLDQYKTFWINQS